MVCCKPLEKTAKFLTKEHLHNDAYYRIGIDDIKATVIPGDVILFEIMSKVSAAIQVLITYAAIFIGKRETLNHCLIDVKAIEESTFTDISRCTISAWQGVS